MSNVTDPVVMKICIDCRDSKPITQFHKRSDSANCYRPSCIECRKLRTAGYYKSRQEEIRKRHAAWKKANKEKIKKDAELYREKHKEKIAAYMARRYLADKEKMTARIEVWRKANLDKKSAAFARRRAAKLQATPSWADDFVISEAYELALLRTKKTGIKWHVDHVVPLQSKKVCGLHCEFNIQVLTYKENISKGNKYWPDMS